LNKQLEVIKKDGVDIDREECVPGITDIAAPVIDSDGKLVVMIGVFIPSPRATKKKIASLVPMVKDTALEISHAIGYRG
jgi:DNA-binding IclR family transcriptional regulator